MTNSQRWWHYTLARTVIMVLADGVIRRADRFVGKSERKAVWFSCREQWEPTATKTLAAPAGMRPATIAEMVQLGGGLARLEVSEAIARHTWADHRRIGGADPRVLDALEKAAREHGADPVDWRVSYHDVPIEQILGVEASEDGSTWLRVGELAPDRRSLVLDADFVKQVQSVLRDSRV
jgi:hypothetical protein